jgi:virginiamycin B lyase
LGEGEVRYMGRSIAKVAGVAALWTLVVWGESPKVAGGKALSATSESAKKSSRPGVKDAGVKRPITTITPVFVFQMDGIPDWVATSPDSLWFSHQPDNVLKRIDPKTNKIVVSIPVGKTPCSGMVFGFDSMWLPHCGEKALYRVDTKTNQVVAKIPVSPANSEGGIAATDDSIWILSDAKGTLSRIDPDTNHVVAEITTPADCFDAASGFGSLWVTCTDSNLLLRVNPANNLIEQRIAVGKGPRFLATGEGAVWTLNEVDGTVTRVDPNTNKAVASIETGTPKAGDIAVGEGAVWVSSFDFPLTRIEPDTNKVTQQWEGRGGDGVRAAFGSVWLSGLKEGFIWRIDPKLL